MVIQIDYYLKETASNRGYISNKRRYKVEQALLPAEGSRGSAESDKEDQKCGPSLRSCRRFVDVLQLG